MGVGPDDTILYKDHGEWGSLDGEVDAAGNRIGLGKMTYRCGESYEGGFVHDKYECEKGIYQWPDGEEYEGAFKEGEHHGKGCTKYPDGNVEYSIYEGGKPTGEGVKLSADRKTAHKLSDGRATVEMSLEEARSVIEGTFGMEFPAPFVAATPALAPATTPAPAITRTNGLFRGLFSSRKVGPDDMILYKDHGEWGSFDGEVDAAGNRIGLGKMTYRCGESYEGGFVHDKYECEKGIYQWPDGEEYEGAFKEGEHHGKGCTKYPDGNVEYSIYEGGKPTGEGVKLSADRKTAHKLSDGRATAEMSLEEARSVIEGTFGMEFPAPFVAATPALAPATTPAPAITRT